MSSNRFILSIRALFGESLLANAVHGASTAERAEEVIQTFIGEVPEEGGEGGEGVGTGNGEGENLDEGGVCIGAKLHA